MKQMFSMLAVIGVEAVIVLAVSVLLGWQFVDVTFFLGLLFIVMTYFMSSRGGFFMNAARLSVQAQSGIRMAEERHAVEWNPLLVGSIVYTVLSLLVTVGAYWQYFA